MRAHWQSWCPVELRGDLAVDGGSVTVLDRPLRSKALRWHLPLPQCFGRAAYDRYQPQLWCSCHVTWQRIVNNTPSWLNARALFDRSQQAEFDRQQKYHADLNDLEQATERLYECSLEAEAHHDERRAKAEADSARLLLEWQLAWKQRQEQAKVMGIVMSSTDDSKYRLWHRQPQHKAPSPNIPRPYATPKEMSTTGHDAMINKELGLENVFDPLQLRNALPTPGPWTPPAYGKDTAVIPPIHKPTLGGPGESGIRGLASGMASPVTKLDDQLLDGLPPGSPIEVGLSWAPGSGWGSSHVACLCPWAHLLYLEPWHGGVLKRLVDFSIQPNCLCRRHEMHAEGGWKGSSWRKRNLHIRPNRRTTPTECEQHPCRHHVALCGIAD